MPLAHPESHVTDPGWQTEVADPWLGAKCREVDPELFFPAPSDRKAAQAAKALCRDCPVAVACLAFAVGQPSLTGIWGGFTEDERIRLRRRSRALTATTTRK